ncbi:MAG: hypothetical protein KatS3mg076_2198 [Candidatus Binatia bacterium]|nr:MAG: hypothetical protein KatS3mg076_2198 [Candidatus Binatia bacterium]
MRWVSWFGVVLVVASSAEASELRRETPESRPYIVEIGEPEPIDEGRLAEEVQRNSDLRDYVRFYGYPDYAEVQEILPDPPWAPYEVRLHYLDRDETLAFGRVYVSPDITDFGLLKYRGALSDADRERLARSRRPFEGDALSRALAAAERAARAAEEAESRSLAAQRAADRAARAAESMEHEFLKELRK